MKRRGRYDEDIARLWPTHSGPEIADLLGVQRGHVYKRAVVMRLPPKPRGPVPTSEHGTRGKYQMGCRCGACRQAQTRYMARLRAANRMPALASSLVRPDRRPFTGHGSVARALAGCDCDRCIEAKRERDEQLNPKPRRWRCGCQPLQVQAGDRCAGCGAVPVWATNHQEGAA